MCQEFTPEISSISLTNVPLVIRQHDAWQLSLHNPSGPVRALTEFPSRTDLSAEDSQTGNFICLEVPFGLMKSVLSKSLT